MDHIPGPSTAPYLRHGKTGENFARLCHFVMTICSDVLRDVLSRHIKPADLRARLDSERPNLERVLNVQQKTELYPKTPSVASTNIRAKTFDISLLYTLLRNICGIQVCDLRAHKKKGWGKTPPPGDYCLCACIEIIREVRNNVTGHIGTGSVEDKDFHTYWNQLKEAVLAIEKEMTGADMYERGIDELYSCDLNPTITAKYVLELTLIKETINLKRERIEDLEETSHNIEEQLVVKREKLETQEMRIQKLERDMALCKQQGMTQEKRLLKRLSEQGTEQEQRFKRLILELEKSLKKRISDHQLIYKSFCRTHPTAVCFMFCIPCQVPVCAKCIIEKHQQHVLDELIKNGIFYIKMTTTDNVTKVTEFKTSFVCKHMSCVTSDKAWFGDFDRLVLVNVRGDVLKEKKNFFNDFVLYGEFTVTSNGDLLLIEESCIKRITHRDESWIIINTDVKPTCIYSSLLDDNILIGMSKLPFSPFMQRLIGSLKVARYNAAGEKLRESIVADNMFFDYIKFITENRFNGDICSVVYSSGDLSLKVLGKLGEDRFTYRGRDESSITGSVTTDILGHILLPMYDRNSNEYHIDMLDHNGNFLSTLLTASHNPALVHVSLCIDNLHRLWYGHDCRVQIYHYLEEEK